MLVSDFSPTKLAYPFAIIGVATNSAFKIQTYLDTFLVTKQ